MPVSCRENGTDFVGIAEMNENFEVEKVIGSEPVVNDERDSQKDDGGVRFFELEIEAIERLRVRLKIRKSR